MSKGVYLIHFERSLAHARHYIGYADDIERRINDHQRGQGGRLLAAVREAGISFQLVRQWKGKGRKFERQLKNRKAAARLCPICNPKHWSTNGASK